MSIPPLVCSTPPPPDQCEEDKDPDDFDIPYDLSQDEDDDGFGYGDFTSYNHYQTNSVVGKVKVSTNGQEISDGIKQSVENQSEGETPDQLQETNTTNENKPKTEEDTNIEDLCLEVNEESIHSNEKENDQSEIEICNVGSSEKVLKLGNDANSEKSSTNSEESAIDTSNIVVQHCEAKLDDEQIDDPSLDIDVQSSEPTSSSNDEVRKNDLSTEDNSDPIKEPNLDDDFGDFDDFQYANLETKTSDVIENCDNPWDTNKADDDDDFGNFTANFDSIERSNIPSAINDRTEFKNDEKDSQNCSVEEDDDEFGDFDDFKSSAVENEADIAVESDLQQLPILNFHASDSEHQIMDSLTKVLTSIFEVEISEPENEFEGNLESMLSETWGHLRETDVRQPYIINWNNSLGQKTLLKALCIDSRNILFAPKWGYNMPKYAVNLSAAPLQPQKPLTSTNPPQSEAVSTEKTAANPGGWTDPFTADGQESCNTENESVVEVTPTDLDVFEAAISAKSDKIYSSTLNVQPLRQISLPDTHIFTPTDSETPTSKTVHYDSGPPILLPQTVLENVKTSETITTEHTNDTPKDDDDYWEFQDFKSSSEKTAANTPSSSARDPPHETKTDNVAIKPNVTYQTQVLQPIKMEPLMPTVNWPDPGEIKETFDDFTDFVANSTWSDKSQEQNSVSQPEKITLEPNVLEKINDRHKNFDTVKETPMLKSNEVLDDDFNKFQSALPPHHIIAEVRIDSLSSNTSNIIPSQNSTKISPDFNNTFPKNNIGKSETISVNPIRPNYAITPNQGNPSHIAEFSATSNMLGNQMPHNLLQPTTSTNLPSSQNKQKTGQILQPLSLESYSQINWPNPGIDLQDLSRFNPVETLQSLKSDLSVGGPSKVSTPVHNQKNVVNNQVPDDDIWGDFVSSKPKQQATLPKKPASFVDEDEWTDFVSSPSVKPQNGLNTISLNVHTNSNIQKSNNINKFPTKNNQVPLDIPTLNYITPKASGHQSFNDRHFQNL